MDLFLGKNQVWKIIFFLEIVNKESVPSLSLIANSCRGQEKLQTEENITTLSRVLYYVEWSSLISFAMNSTPLMYNNQKENDLNLQFKKQSTMDVGQVLYEMKSIKQFYELKNSASLYDFAEQILC